MAKDSKYFHLADDIQKIQVKTNMYINEYGEAGSFHLAREIIQNNFDECLDDDSNGNKIIVSYDMSTDILSSSDNGRSFDESQFPMSTFCTTLQSGSKFFRSSGAASAGEFGVGLTVVNALSDYFKITAYREKEKTIHILEYSEGSLINDETKNNTKGIHGTTVEFRASKKYMGKDVKLPVEDVINWMEMLFYLDTDRLESKKITAEFSVYDGMKLVNTYKFKPRKFSDLLKKMIPNNVKKSYLTNLCALSGSTSFIENSKTLTTDDTGKTNVSMVDVKKTVHLDVAFLYCIDPYVNDIANYDTYCNYTNTIENGVHLTAFEESYCRYMQNATNDSMSEAQKNKLKITWDDIRNNLFCVINLSTDAYVGFVGNAKTRISNNELIPYMKSIITEELDKFFKSNTQLLNEFIKIIKLNAKARLEAAKAKSATQVEKLNTFKEHEMKNYIRANNTGKQWKEIFLVEGDSASGTARNGCDPDTQAFFLFRGVTANPLKCSLSEIMENKEWRDLVTILKTGIGPKFDPSKLYFNRINIFTDSDVDGYYISAGILAFFYIYMRPIIESGKLYKVFAPLYSLDDKDHPYVVSKAEMVSAYHDKIVKNYKVKILTHDKYMSKNELYEFLIDTYDYRENLIRAAKDSGKVNKFLLESVIAYLTLFDIVRDENDFDDLDKVFDNQKFIKNFMSLIQKKFKEVTVDDTCRISGIVDGKMGIIKVNRRFFKKTSELIPVYKKYGYEIEVSEKGKEPVKMTVGEFLDRCTSLIPKIITRFKGLGELNGDQIYDTALNINNRISIQYTVEDVERELAIFQITHGNNKHDVENRKSMMKKYKIKRDDLDN